MLKHPTLQGFPLLGRLLKTTKLVYRRCLSTKWSHLVATISIICINTERAFFFLDPASFFFFFVAVVRYITWFITVKSVLCATRELTGYEKR